MTSIMSSLVKGTINPLSWLQVQGSLFSFHDTVRNTPLPPVTAPYPTTENMLCPWSQQARQLTPQ